MADTSFTIQQNIFKNPYPPISVISLDESKLVSSPHILQQLLATVDSGGVIGLAPVYSAKLRLSSHKGKKNKRTPNLKTPQYTRGRVLLANNILCHPERRKYAFRMERLSAALYLDQNMRITDGVDLLSTSKAGRRSLDAVMAALGGEAMLHKSNMVALFEHEETIRTSSRDVALQAWAACRAANLPSLTRILSRIPRIDTLSMDEEQLCFLAQTLRDADRQDALKPIQVKNDVKGDFKHKSGNLILTSDRFKTRIMRSSTQLIKVVTGTSRGTETTTTGRVKKVDGRDATISLHGNFNGGEIRSVYTIGRDDPTNAEGQRANIILMAFQQTISLVQQPFVRSIWLPHEQPSWPTETNHPVFGSPSVHFPYRPLNLSQTRAVESILSTRNEDRITVIHGPPGTGKTTVIAATVTSLMAFPSKRTIWLVAQSNVAVKNIAEKLADVGFLDFKLLVSKDFRYDWHEHLYQKIQLNVIQSDDFPADRITADRLLLGSRVILCTLSMLSNTRIAEFTRLVPVEVAVVDEASQIEIGDYLPLLFRFQMTLRKLAFIGDNKQLAPYGQDDIGDLRSIFEMPHLRDRAIFLDTQSVKFIDRMPVPIGSFISKHVYKDKLTTVHNIKSLLSCRFVDVRGGNEQRMGNSWINQKEVMAVIRFARKYYAAGKAYRIITPYDSQRNMLEKELKAARIPWEDKCFNVDSFQGNEEDHIIISLVRSDKIGFLKNIRRTNVMLSRCKKSMVICTSRAFLNGVAASSLMGTLATVLGEQAWLNYP